jgi:nucleoside-diphosphate kinase
MKEFTLSIIKPDAIKQNIIGKIYSIFENASLSILTVKSIRISIETAKVFYCEHQQKPFFSELVEFITSNYCFIQILYGKNAIKVNRELMGSTNPIFANPWSIRGIYGTDICNNVVHGSDSYQSAQREMKIFFSPKEISSLQQRCK